MKNHEDKFPAFEEKHLVVECKHCNNRFYSKEALRIYGRKVHKIFKTEKLPNGKYKGAKPRSISLIDIQYQEMQEMSKKFQKSKHIQ